MSMHTVAKCRVWRGRLSRLVASVQRSMTSTTVPPPYVGRHNRKTGGSLNEGTTPGVTCASDVCRTCGRECYALWHEDVPYVACRRHHAVNTVVRRVDPVRYYAAFFDDAVERGSNVVRVNESGDFENVEQLYALYVVAERHPSITVIGYTRRPELANHLAGDQVPTNVHIRYSLYRDAACTAPAGVRVTRVTNWGSTCPAQIAAAKNRTWHCADCAAHRCGCCGNAACITFQAH